MQQSVTIRCPQCLKTYELPKVFEGQPVRCQCSHEFQISNETVIAGMASPPVMMVGNQPGAAAGTPAQGQTPGSGQGPAGGASAAGGVTANTAAAVETLGRARGMILEEVGKVIVGQKQVLDEVLTAFFARGHCLLMGVPGLAKTLMVQCLARTMMLDFKRIQFTPDLMPTDITGTNILEEDPQTRQRHFVFHKGPIFTNVLLADEINRTPPKTQAALLEAMQEQKVTASGTTYSLPNPFLALATQNPLEQEGTYPLPEAQLDRFLFLVKVDYPDERDEQQILLTTTGTAMQELRAVLDGPSILRYQNLVRQVPVSEHVAGYAARLTRATRPKSADAPDFINKWVRYGCGPRAGQALILAAKAHVILNGRFNVSCEDIRRYALPVMRHRMILNFAAVSEGVDTDEVIRRLLDHVGE